MELYQLRTFAAVAEEAHLTRAAERLHLSQPAVSGHIKALEQELDVRLFERTATGMVLTESGVPGRRCPWPATGSVRWRSLARDPSGAQTG